MDANVQRGDRRLMRDCLGFDRLCNDRPTAASRLEHELGLSAAHQLLATLRRRPSAAV